MSNINELILQEVRIHFDLNKFNKDDLDKIQELMHKNGVHFDYGTDLTTNRHDWELDSYEGPMYTSPTNSKHFPEHKLPPSHLMHKNPGLLHKLFKK